MSNKAFPSQYATLIWDKLYTVLIPDQLTLSPGYIKTYGTYHTSNKEVDKMMSTNFTQVMIPIAKILEYFEDGVEIQIPSRKDLISIHKDIELYLQEWREHIKLSINSDINQHKKFILSLEKLSLNIYNKAKPSEVIDNLLLSKKVGLLNPLETIEQVNKQSNEKPDYQGLKHLIKKPNSRF